FFQAEDGIRGVHVTGVQTCALPILGLARSIAATARDQESESERLHGDVSRIAVIAERTRTGAGELAVAATEQASALRDLDDAARSEERRVGEERRSRWALKPPEPSR